MTSFILIWKRRFLINIALSAISFYPQGHHQENNGQTST